MRSTPEWEVFYNDVKALAECFLSYQEYLVKQKQKVQTNQQLCHPGRSLADNCSVQIVS